jgi:hypothetical protein
MKTSSAKAKGRKLQQWTANRIVERFSQHLKEDDVVSRPMGSGGVDILLSPLAQEVFPVSLECKNTKKQPGAEALTQAEANVYKDTVPAVVWKPPGKQYTGSLAIMKFDDLITLIETIRNEDK